MPAPGFMASFGFPAAMSGAPPPDDLSPEAINVLKMTTGFGGGSAYDQYKRSKGLTPPNENPFLSAGQGNLVDYMKALMPDQGPSSDPTQGSPQGYRDPTDLINNRNRLMDLFTQRASQAPPVMPHAAAPSMNPWVAALMGIAGVAANRENPRLQYGTQVLNGTVPQLMQGNADRANTNAQRDYESQMQARQASLTGDQMNAQNAQQQLSETMGQNVALREDALKRYGIETGYAGKQYTADAAAKARTTAAQITTDGRKYVATQASGDKQLADMILALNKAPAEMRPPLYEALKNYQPANGGVNPFANMDSDAIKKTADMTPQEQLLLARSSEQKAKATDLTNHAHLLTTQYGLAPARAANLAALTADIPALDASKIARAYADVDNLESMRGDRIFKQGLAANEQQLNGYSKSILGIRDQLNTLSTQMNALRSERAGIEKTVASLGGDAKDPTSAKAQALARISAIDQNVGRMTGVYNELSARSTGIQKAIAPVDEMGNVSKIQGVSPQALGPTAQSRVKPRSQASDAQWWAQNKNKMAMPDRQAYIKAYTSKYGAPPP